MKLSPALPLLFSCTAAAGAADLLYQPHRITFDALLKDEPATRDGFMGALRNVGLVSITNVPSYEVSKREALSWDKFQECLRASEATVSQAFADGTVRRTLATHTVPGPGGSQKIQHRADDSDACRVFTKSSDKMRSAIAQATKAFASRLSEATGADITTPILATQDGFPFETIEDVVENGEHLEHFHSYQRFVDEEEGTVETIGMHTDQGFFIIFTPGQIVSKQGSSKVTGGFFIELQDGSHVELDLNEGDLVMMLGDGVNQYINNNIPDDDRKLRATPHALTMPLHGEDEARTWYGRMVLPPSSAYIPHKGMTYGHLRQIMIADATNSNGASSSNSLDLGCSSSFVARTLAGGNEDTTCAEGSMYCWARCMNHTEYYPVSPEICDERGLELKCINPRGQVYVEGHGDFFPQCSDATEVATPFPTLPDYPRNDEACSKDEWVAYSKAEEYSFCYDIGEFEKAKFCWNVVDENYIEGRLTFNGLFGFLAFGFENIGGGINGMLGASIILALPGSNYTAVDGLDLSMEPNVKEYVISEEYTRFRHWSQPVPNRDTTNYDVTSTDCFTALTFKTDSINSRGFNIAGSDRMVWAANGKDNYVEFHGRDQRNRFEIEWATGKAWEDEKEEDNTVTADNGGDDHDNNPLAEGQSTTSAGCSYFKTTSLYGIGLVVAIVKMVVALK